MNHRRIQGALLFVTCALALVGCSDSATSVKSDAISSSVSSITMGNSSTTSTVATSSVANSSVIAVSSSSIALSSTATISSSSTTAACTNTYGTNTVTDCRDNKTYSTVTIGTQVWMAQNLNIGAMVLGTASTANQSNDAVIEKYCYGDLAANCTTDGGLYQWAEAMGLPSTCNSTACASSISSINYQGICPVGWHIPKSAESSILATYLGGSPLAGDKLKTSTGWAINTGTNSSGFTVRPVGDRFDGGGFQSRDSSAYYWESDESTAALAFIRYLSYSTGNLYGFSKYKASGYSVRCIKD